jgi:hypothetical protein
MWLLSQRTLSDILLALIMDAIEMERNARLAILKIRAEKHKKGYHFMINSAELAIGHCWLEYANGDIHLVKLSESRLDFDIVKILSKEEANDLRISMGIDG